MSFPWVTFVPNGKSLNVCFSVLWNEALVVIKLILSSLWQLIQFLGEMKATGNMFWINSITLIWAQSSIYDFGPWDCSFAEKKNAFNCYLGICLWRHIPSANEDSRKNKPKTFILLMMLNVETLFEHKCLFDITLSLKKESWFMLMSSLIGIGKIALA